MIPGLTAILPPLSPGCSRAGDRGYLSRGMLGIIPFFLLWVHAGSTPPHPCGSGHSLPLTVVYPKTFGSRCLPDEIRHQRPCISFSPSAFPFHTQPTACIDPGFLHGLGRAAWKEKDRQEPGAGWEWLQIPGLENWERLGWQQQQQKNGIVQKTQENPALGISNRN